MRWRQKYLRILGFLFDLMLLPLLCRCLRLSLGGTVPLMGQKRKTQPLNWNRVTQNSSALRGKEKEEISRPSLLLSPWFSSGRNAFCSLELFWHYSSLKKPDSGVGYEPASSTSARVEQKREERKEASSCEQASAKHVIKSVYLYGRPA